MYAYEYRAVEGNSIKFPITELELIFNGAGSLPSVSNSSLTRVYYVPLNQFVWPYRL